MEIKNNNFKKNIIYSINLTQKLNILRNICIIFLYFIIPVLLTNEIKITLIQSGNSGAFLNSAFSPSEILINNESISNYIINPSGQTISLIWEDDLTNCEDMFNTGSSIIETIDLSNFSTSNVKKMSNMFANQKNLNF